MERQHHADGLVHGVIVAVSRADGRWLLIRRSAHVAAPLAICFPGGGIELGEDHALAAAREFREELAGEVEPVREVWQWRALIVRFCCLAGWRGCTLHSMNSSPLRWRWRKCSGSRPMKLALIPSGSSAPNSLSMP
ncbi:MAG: NUDIX hydrolase [Phycisphaerales bacterium]|nr:NUDIX hydrolase [Phycisphaerales bacterium]